MAMHEIWKVKVTVPGGATLYFNARGDNKEQIEKEIIENYEALPLGAKVEATKMVKLVYSNGVTLYGESHDTLQ